MAKGFSIHIGVNEVDRRHYKNFQVLEGCENDARDMHQIAQSQGYYRSIVLLSRQAIALAVITALSQSSNELVSGDILFLSYSGHGSFVPTKDKDEIDGRDETWCLYDRQMLDNELFTLYSRFRPGVRILVLSDSCHSGTIIKLHGGLNRKSENIETNSIKNLPESVSYELFNEHKDLYTQIQKNHPNGKNVNVMASILLLSACQDNEKAEDGVRNSQFTESLRKIWNNGQFSGNYPNFHSAVSAELMEWTTDQHPNYFRAGTMNPYFEAQRPFSI